jgi:Flp pilus assembly protein TadG
MRLRSLIFGTEGATAVEFGFSSAALILLVFGIIEMGRMLWTQQVIQAVASETARCLAISSPSCPDAGTFAVTSAQNRGITTLQAGNVTVSANDACGSSVGSFTKVTISFAFATVVPAYVPVPSGGLSATGCFPH